MLLTAIAMLAFAANSLLCRMALGAGLVDAASFTSVRIISGAVMLGLIVLPRLRSQGRPKVDLRAVAMLFAYMIFFSFAYLSLSAGTGALILFGAVQVTMFVVGLRGGEHFSKSSWAGLALAVAAGAVASGLGYFVWYAAMRGLTAIRAATVRLSVPVIAAIGGVLLLGEEVNLRLVLASVATLGGIAIVLRISQAN